MVDEANADNPQEKLPLVRLRVGHQVFTMCQVSLNAHNNVC